MERLQNEGLSGLLGQGTWLAGRLNDSNLGTIVGKSGGTTETHVQKRRVVNISAENTAFRTGNSMRTIGAAILDTGGIMAMSTRQRGYRRCDMSRVKIVVPPKGEDLSRLLSNEPEVPGRERGGGPGKNFRDFSDQRFFHAPT
jgi:hypothetical protein